MASAETIVVSGYARTPFGKFGKTLRTLDLPLLGAMVVREAIRRAGLEPADIQEIAIGVNFPGSERSIARQVMLQAHIPDDKVAYTVDRACCSSLTAVSLVSRGLRLGDISCAVAGGVENLSKVPYFLEDMRFGNRLGHITLTDHLVVSCPHTGIARAIQASKEAERYGISRKEQDEWALRSQENYVSAKERGLFNEEIFPVKAQDRDGKTTTLAEDEVPRPDTTLDKLTGLPTIYGSSTVTAGNAPDLSTGASALILTTRDARNVKKRALLTGWAMVSGDSQHIASMPAYAAKLALARTGLTIDDIDLIEINEAFAAVPLVTTHLLADGNSVKVKQLRDRTNIHGGAIALGHPTGATAVRLVMHLITALRNRGGGAGLVTICGGVGEAEAVIVLVND